MRTGLLMVAIVAMLAACTPPSGGASNDGMSQLQRSVQSEARGVGYTISDERIRSATSSELGQAKGILNDSGERPRSAAKQRAQLELIFG